jgi:hypothetical protein
MTIELCGVKQSCFAHITGGVCMKVSVLGYKGEHELPEYVDPDQTRVIEVPDDSHAVIVHHGVFLYGGEMPSSQPEDGFAPPKKLGGGDLADYESYPLDFERHGTSTPFGTCDLVTVCYIMVAKEPFQVIRKIAACDENWGSEYPTYVKEVNLSKPIKELEPLFRRENESQADRKLDV